MKLNLLLLSALVLFSCQPAEDGAWAAFKQCATNQCVKEAMAVKDALLKNPKGLMADFLRTYEKGEDHLIGWLYLMRDSVLTNPAMGAIEQRIAMQQSIIAAAKSFEKDPKLGEIAKTITDEIGTTAIAAELEDEVVEPSSDPVTGTYAFDKGNAGSGELQISQVSFDKIKFKLAVFGGPPAHNQGMMEGETTFSAGNEATFSTTEFGGTCTLQFSWNGDVVTVKTLKGDSPTCGFGNNVSADGTYARKSYANPMLSAAEAKKAALLTGEWQSASDPKAGLKIADGRYSDLYEMAEGQAPVPPLRYIYHPVCPKDCNPVAPTPCLSVIGQDVVCYAIVKADGKTLELSQIGGTGNTNKYVKKK